MLRVRLTPKSSVDRIEGIVETPEGPALQARVRAVPADGEANSALERLVAEWLGLAKSSVSVTGGHKSRIKTIEVSGNSDALAALLATKLSDGKVANKT